MASSTECIQIVSAIAAIAIAVYYYLTSSFDFWKNRHIPGPPPLPVFGNIAKVICRKELFGNYLKQLYDKYENEPMFGIFMRDRPALVLRDLDLIKDVLVKDFSTFDSRGNTMPARADPLTENLFNLEPARWRPLRARLSPVFTSGQLKEMFPLIVECSEQLEQFLTKVAEKGELLDCREIAARFTTDVIGSCAFGINMNALSDEQSEFRRVGKKIFDMDAKAKFRAIIREMFPRLYNLLGYVLPYTEQTRFLTKVVSDTMKYREDRNIVRPDIVNLLLELRRNPRNLEHIELTDSFLAAQAFVFFAAGFETSSTTIAHTLYEMALNPGIQDKLRAEMKEVIAKNNGNINYDDIKKMEYLQKVFKETLRKYPPGTLLRRNCNSAYTFSGGKVTISKGTSVLVPVYGLHRDPKIYQNPETFDPERFSESAIATRHPMAYLPFGDGPRNCIGARFAIYQTKVGLIKMLQNFKVEPCEETMIPYEINPSSFTLSPKDGIILKIRKV